MGKFESDPLLVFDLNRPGPSVPSQMERLAGFEQQDCGAGFGPRPVLDATGHDEQLAGFENDLLVTHLKNQAALKAKEHLVLLLMAVPLEHALGSSEFQVLSIGLADDAGTPRVAEGCKLGLQVNGFSHFFASEYKKKISIRLFFSQRWTTKKATASRWPNRLS